jgi:dolichyl-phosphate-mannose-protein mannosyltransferase
MNPRRRPWSRLDTAAIIAITSIAGLLRSIHLTRPPHVVFDELFYAPESCNIVYRSQAICGVRPDAVTPHPPLAKLLVSLGIRAFGYQPLGWRIAPLIAGTVTVALLYLLGRRILSSTAGAALAAGFLAIDPLHIVLSRLAMLDVFVTLFAVAGFLFLTIDLDHLETRSGDRRRGFISRPWLLAAGVAAGAAAASKWEGFLALAGLVVLWAVRTASEQRPGSWLRRIGAAVQADRWALVAGFVIAPLIVYVVSFIGRIHGSLLSWPWVHGSWIRTFFGLQKGMLEYHLRLKYPNAYASPAWSWPLLKRPVIFLYTASRGRVQEILAIGNPVVWWPSLLALVYLGVRLVRRGPGDRPAATIVVGFAALYLPWLALSTRPLTFLYYLLPAVPFMYLAVAAVIDPHLASWAWRGAAVTLCALAVAFLLFFYPVLTAKPLSGKSVEARVWFRDCQRAPQGVTPAGWCWG